MYCFPEHSRKQTAGDGFFAHNFKHLSFFTQGHVASSPQADGLPHSLSCALLECSCPSHRPLHNHYKLDPIIFRTSKNSSDHLAEALP